MHNRSSVVDKILEKGKRAMRGDIPILYIKTDSDILINRVVTDPDNPLVLLRERTGEHAKRPHTQWKEAKVHINAQAIDGYNEGVPQLYIDGELNSDFWIALEEPAIWVQKMPDGDETSEVGNQRREILRNLERYVCLHQDETHPLHEALHSCVVLLYSSKVYLTPMLKTYTEIIDVEYPNENDIKNQIRMQTGNPAALTERVLDELTTNLRGFNSEEIAVLLKLIDGNVDVDGLDRTSEQEMFKILHDFKNKNLEGGLLELVNAECEIGGMERYKSDLQRIKDPLLKAVEFRRKRGVEPPKGDLLMGIQGCGKSELAKYTARELGLSLLKLDMNRVMQKYVGESEEMLRVTIKLAETMSPCVLHLDELEKALAGAGGGGSESDTVMRRMIGYLLSWMQDHTAPVYLFATANDITGMPPELFRSGRFRNKYAVYLPTEDECIAIFQASMRFAEKNAARDRGISVDQIRMFGPGCADKEMLRSVIRDMMIINGKPRIMIGSDIREIVTTALYLLDTDGEIDAQEWERALREACQDRVVEGDSEENVDRLASSYCRLLRKGFRPASDDALFDRRDYHTDYVRRIEAREKNPQAYTEEETQILQRRKQLPEKEYDKAVYELLFERINDMASRIEKNMRESLSRV